MITDFGLRIAFGSIRNQSVQTSIILTNSISAVFTTHKNIFVPDRIRNPKSVINCQFKKKLAHQIHLTKVFSKM